MRMCAVDNVKVMCGLNIKYMCCCAVILLGFSSLAHFLTDNQND